VRQDAASERHHCRNTNVGSNTMSKKRKFIILFLVVVPSVCFIDRFFFMIDRIDDQLWEARGGQDYLIVGEDVFGRSDYQLVTDTLRFNSGKTFVVKYCIFDNLWIESVDAHEIAWYLGQ